MPYPCILPPPRSLVAKFLKQTKEPSGPPCALDHTFAPFSLSPSPLCRSASPAPPLQNQSRTKLQPSNRVRHGQQRVLRPSPAAPGCKPSNPGDRGSASHLCLLLVTRVCADPSRIRTLTLNLFGNVELLSPSGRLPTRLPSAGLPSPAADAVPAGSSSRRLARQEGWQQELLHGLYRRPVLLLRG